MPGLRGPRHCPWYWILHPLTLNTPWKAEQNNNSFHSCHSDTQINASTSRPFWWSKWQEETLLIGLSGTCSSSPTHTFCQYLLLSQPYAKKTQNWGPESVGLSSSSGIDKAARPRANPFTTVSLWFFFTCQVEIIAAGDRMLENMLAKTRKCNMIINWSYNYDSCSSKYEVEITIRVGSKESSECRGFR